MSVCQYWWKRADQGRQLAHAGLFFACLVGGGLLPLTASAADLDNGKKLYVAHCAGCHGLDGVSVLPDVPSLVGVKIITMPDADLTEVIFSGREMMPPYFGILDEREIYDVTSYLRTLH